MSPEPMHRVRQQVLQVTTDNEQLALTLQARLQDLNRNALLPAMDRVLSEFALPGRHVRLARLDVNLGTLTAAELETEGSARLTAALREALTTALAGIANGNGAGDGIRTLTTSESRLEMLEEWLTHGTLSFWAGSGTSLQDVFLELLAPASAELRRLLYRAGTSGIVRERMVRQLDAVVLARIVHLLEPEHAHLVLAYLADLRQTHRVKPIVPLGEAAFDRLAWRLALAYLLQKSASRFHQKSYLAFLVQGFADEHRLSFPQLLLALSMALREAGTEFAQGSSLPSVLAELIEDAGLSDVPSPPAQSASQKNILEEYLLCGRGQAVGVSRPEAAKLIFEWLTLDTDALRQALRRHGGKRGVLERLVFDLPAAVLQQLLNLLEPEHAAVMVELIEELANLHRRAPVLEVSDASFERLLWLTTFAYVLRDAGTQFNRRSYVERLLEELASSECISYSDILHVIRLGLQTLALTGQLRYSLVDILQEVVANRELPGSDALEESSLPQLGRELERQLAAGGGVRTLGALTTLIESSTAPEAERILTAALRRSGGAGRRALQQLLAETRENLTTQLQQLVRSALAADKEVSRQAAGVLREFDRIERLSCLLRDSLLPWQMALQHPEPALQQTSDLLASLTKLQIARVFAGATAAEQWHMAWNAVIAMGNETDILFLVKRLSPGLAASSPFWDSLRSFSALAKDRTTFFAQVVHALVTGDNLDFEQMAAGSEDLFARPATWDSSKNCEAMLAYLRRDPLPPSAPSWNVLVGEVLGTDDRDTQIFLRGIVATEGLRRRLAETLTDDSFRRALFLIHEPGHAEMQSLFDAILRLPESLRPALSQVRDAVLRGPAMQATLELLFGQEIPKPIRAFTANRMETGAERTSSEPSGSPASVADRDFDALWLFLAEGGAATAIDDIASMLDDALRETPGQLRSVLIEGLVDASTRERWTTTLPESALARVICALAPREARSLLEATETLAIAWQQTATPGLAIFRGRQACWSFMLEFLSDESGGILSVEKLTLAFIRHISTRLHATHPGGKHTEFGHRFLTAATDAARQSGRSALTAVLARQRTNPNVWETEAMPAKQPLHPSKPSVPRRAEKPSRKPAADQSNDAGPLYVRNAGIVLLAPFLPRLFSLLEMTELRDGTTVWATPETALRAVRLSQWLVDGNTQALEPALVLNKMLCGLPPPTPLDATIDVTQAEHDAMSQLLHAVVANWTAIANSSVQALQETFLQREGRLDPVDGAWKLLVQRKTVDVLVDQLSWSISVIRLPWMASPLYVTW